ncbi:MAG: protoporphyrinogen oxidase, partial [Acidobacteria bacterium]
MHHVVVVGGGIAGLTAGWELARRARRQHHDVEVTVIEARGRCGGKVVTRRRGDFVLEGGPDAFVARKPALYELACELGLEGRLLPSNDDRGGVALAAGKRLVPLSPGLLQLAPGGWREIAATPLLSWSGKLRWWAERWQPARRAETDESVADFVRRRCGREVLERIAEPILASLHVGDVERMSLAATCPHLRDREQRRGRLGGGRPAP